MTLSFFTTGKYCRPSGSLTILQYFVPTLFRSIWFFVLSASAGLEFVLSYTLTVSERFRPKLVQYQPTLFRHSQHNLHITHYINYIMYILVFNNVFYANDFQRTSCRNARNAFACIISRTNEECWTSFCSIMTSPTTLCSLPSVFSMSNVYELMNS